MASSQHGIETAGIAGPDAGGRGIVQFAPPASSLACVDAGASPHSITPHSQETT